MIINQYDRKLDELDILKLRIAAWDTGAGSGSYAVVASDGTPICGFLKHGDTHISFRLIATQWAHIPDRKN